MSMDEVKGYLSRIENKLERIDEKQDAQDAKLASMDITLAKQEKELTIHIEGVKTLKSELESQRAEIRPIKEHVVVMQSAWKVLLGIGAIAGILYSIKQLILE